jgi:hypothetical protein
MGAYILNCSFLDNTVTAKKGLAAATKQYGGAGLWANMTANTVPLNVGLCTFMGNHVAFDGTEANIAGGAIAVFKAKMCLMDNIILANDLKIESASPVWSDLYVSSTDVNLWRDTYNLYSASSDINGWEDDIVNTFGGALEDGRYTPYIKQDGTYPIYQKNLVSYNLVCLPTVQRYCESAFTYDLNGDGAVNGYVAHDQMNRARAVMSCLGAVEYTGEDKPETPEEPDQPGGFEETESGQQTKGSEKFIKNGTVVIIRNGICYDILGNVL